MAVHRLYKQITPYCCVLSHIPILHSCSVCQDGQLWESSWLLECFHFLGSGYADSFGISVIPKTLLTWYTEWSLDQWFPTLVLMDPCPICFPTIPVLTASDWLNPPDHCNQHWIEQWSLKTRVGSHCLELSVFLS